MYMPLQPAVCIYPSVCSSIFSDRA